jgi:ribosomal protein L33
MHLTLANMARKGKTLLVMVKSTASNHTMLMYRDKAVEKYEFVRFDPVIERNVLYKEQKKLRTIDKPEGSN